ncbi:Wzy polymerase domain-containing protein [Roseateles chitinivorans]|uniref:Wzy polymerase domain-containing protein n=1 Tax=Roseateles chitinivorans TaxID=2917965 RepID=UPI003D67E27C
MIGVHSQVEYPLWYAYFLLPAALAFGLCLSGKRTADVAVERAPVARPADMPLSRRPLLAVLGLAITAAVPLVVVDYLRIVHIYAPPTGAASLDDRILSGQRSPLFALQADYAEATVQPPARWRSKRHGGPGIT